MLLGDLEEPLASLERQRHAGWVLEGRQQVHEFRARLAVTKVLVQRLDQHAVLVDGDGQVARPLVLPGGEGAHERRRFGDDGVAVVECDATDQVQALQRPGEDHDALRADVDSAPPESFGDDLAQCQQALA